MGAFWCPFFSRASSIVTVVGVASNPAQDEGGRIKLGHPKSPKSVTYVHFVKVHHLAHFVPVLLQDRGLCRVVVTLHGAS